MDNLKWKLPPDMGYELSDTKVGVQIDGEIHWMEKVSSEELLNSDYLLKLETYTKSTEK